MSLSESSGSGTPASTRERFYPALDGLRAFAIGGVMLLHYLAAAPTLPTIFGRALHEMAAVGMYGVDLFFVLSGFLITGILFDSRDSPSYFRTFYIRRVLRIFPLYYVALVAVGIVLPVIVPETFGWAPGSKMSLGWFWTYLANWPLAMHGWQASPRTLGHFWTLAIEEQFYLVWPAVVWLTGRRRLFVVCVAMLVVASGLRAVLTYVWRPLSLIEVATFTRMDGLLLGAIVAVWWSGPRTVARWRGWPWWTLAVSLSALVPLAVWRGGLALGDNAVLIVGLPLIVAFCAALLALTLLSERESRLVRGLSSRPLRFVGKRSYALYVLHYPILAGLNAVGLTVSGLMPRLHSLLLSELTILLVNSAAAMGAATVSWRLLEGPFLRLKSRFPYETVEPISDVVKPSSAFA
jgi:peptidoglycan/LPS O-acetylase OafA/YrhL